MDNESKTSQESNPIETLFSNKELLSRLTEIAKDLKTTMGEPPSDASDEPTKSDSDTPPAPPTDGLVAALSDPTLMAKLPELLSLFTSGTSAPKKAPPDKQTALLLALRPYLSPARCEAIDYVTRLRHMGDVLKNLKPQ